MSSVPPSPASIMSDAVPSTARLWATDPSLVRLRTAPASTRRSSGSKAKSLRVTSRVETPEGAATSLRSEEHTSELQSLMRISYAVFCLKKKIKIQKQNYKLRK